MTGVLLLVGGVNWLRSLPRPAKGVICRACGFDLRGHIDTPDLCPECGRPPQIDTLGALTSRWMAKVSGVFLILGAVGCMLFALDDHVTGSNVRRRGVVDRVAFMNIQRKYHGIVLRCRHLAGVLQFPSIGGGRSSTGLHQKGCVF